MSGAVGIAEQRSIVLRHLPAVMAQVAAMLRRGDYDLLSMVDGRLTSGERVFGDRIMQMPESELYHEGTEELADSLLYYAFRRHTLMERI